jgi:hypothetical protein
MAWWAAGLCNSECATIECATKLSVLTGASYEQWLIDHLLAHCSTIVRYRLASGCWRWVC